ncbi:MAG: PadR family transcriptional regulator [bacterium]
MSKDWVSQMRKGVAELCVLSVLGQGEAYGYEILAKIRSNPNLSLGDSTLYLILARLEKEKLVKLRLAPSSSGPARRYFSLTGMGRQRLVDMSIFWDGFSKDVSLLLKE